VTIKNKIEAWATPYYKFGKNINKKTKVLRCWRKQILLASVSADNKKKNSARSFW
jgi:hypothetical protein